MDTFKDLLKDREKDVAKLVDKHKYVTQEFQDYGYRLAVKLDDLPRVSLYIKLAKDKPRAFIEQALSFAADYPKARSKSRLFMWKLKDLEKDYKEKNPSKFPEVKKVKKPKKTAKSKKAVKTGKPAKPKKDTKPNKASKPKVTTKTVKPKKE